VERGGKDLSDSDDEEVIQYSSDEMCIIKHNDGSKEVVIMEAGGILVGATAKEVAPHAESTWERGQTALEALRDELADDADELVPMVNGGLILSKLRSLMHDMVSAYIFFSLSLCLSLSLSLSTIITPRPLFVNRSVGRTGRERAVGSAAFFVRHGQRGSQGQAHAWERAHGLDGPQRTGALV